MIDTINLRHSFHKRLSQIIGCSETRINSGLQKFQDSDTSTLRTQKSNFADNLTSRNPNTCHHLLDMQVAIISIPRWMLDCECMDNLLSTYGDVVIEVCVRQTTLHWQRETIREAQPNPNKRQTEMLINCRMWTTFPQTHILLKVILSCTFLKITKQ